MTSSKVLQRALGYLRICGLYALSSVVLASALAHEAAAPMRPHEVLRHRCAWMHGKSPSDLNVPSALGPVLSQAPRNKRHISSDEQPQPPSNLVGHSESFHAAMATWEPPSELPEYYVFGVGSSPGEADLKWWQVTYSNKATILPLQYGIEPGSIIYFTVKSVSAAGIYSSSVSTSPLVLTNELLGASGNVLNVDYSTYGLDLNGQTKIEPWDDMYKAQLDHFITRMLPIIEELYGPPAHSYTVTLVRNLYYANSAIFIPKANEIHMNDEFYPQLITHELIHAFRDNVTVTSNEFWGYDNTLSGFEEGFAQAVSYECMNRYAELYPDDPYVTSGADWGSDYHWDYDFQNVPQLGTTDFWSAYGGLYLAWTRYEMAAAAIRKLQIESGYFRQTGMPSPSYGMQKEKFYRSFNKRYYEYLNNNPSITPSRHLVKRIIASLLPTIEGQNPHLWIDRQHVLACAVSPGKKVWVRTQHYPYFLWYNIYQTINHYQTHRSGTDWAYWDGTQWVYPALELLGIEGIADLRDSSGQLVWQGQIVNGEPGIWGFGYDQLILATDDPVDDVMVGPLSALERYAFTASYPDATTTVYRIVGDELVGSNGVWGGVVGANEGRLYIDHLLTGAEPPLALSKGAFQGDRAFAGVSSPTGSKLIPGKLQIRLETAHGDYYTEQNIDRGSPVYGNQIFLLKKQNMIPLKVWHKHHQPSDFRNQD